MGGTSVHTDVDLRDDRGARDTRTWRRLGLAALVLLLLLALAGVFGIRSATTSEKSQGRTLTVDHLVVTRAGIALPFHVRVEHDGGITGTFTLRISRELFEHFDFQNFYPNPAKETGSRDFVFYEFDPPPGDTFKLDLDARTAPDQNGSTDVYEVALIVDDAVVTTVDFRMWVAP